jgi:POT family proton-dependent oligopeptide transporter
MLNGTLKDTGQLQELANNAVISKQPVIDLMVFSQNYIDVFARGYNWAFAVAAGAMILSLLVYLIFFKLLPNKEVAVKAKTDEQKIAMSKNILTIVVPLVLFGISTYLIYLLGLSTGIKQIDYKLGMAFGLFVAFVSYMFMVSTHEEKPRVVSLLLVFVVVIFFWMSFHQNGLTLTLFARDYTVKQVGAFTNLFFTLPSMLAVLGTIAGLIMLLKTKMEKNARLWGTVLFVISFLFTSFFLWGFDPTTLLGRFLTPFGPINAISPEVFQSFNPLFIVALTPLVMGFFAYLNNKGKDPSTPKKIGIGMIIAALGFVLVLIASLDLVSPYLLGGAAAPEASRVSPYWLMSSYLILTIAELFLSPMGLSFVSKVAPSRFQGLMQGGWLLATAVGNKFLFVGSLMWGRIDLYLLWGIFIICCALSAIFIFSIMKKLENATK